MLLGVCLRARGLLSKCRSSARCGGFYGFCGSRRSKRKDKKKEVVKKLIKYDPSFELERNRIDVSRYVDVKMFNRYF